MINLLLKSGLTVVIFFTDEKNLQRFGLTGELNSIESYYMILPFQSQFLVLQLVK